MMLIKKRPRSSLKRMVNLRHGLDSQKIAMAYSSMLTVPRLLTLQVRNLVLLIGAPGRTMSPILRHRQRIVLCSTGTATAIGMITPAIRSCLLCVSQIRSPLNLPLPMMSAALVQCLLVPQRSMCSITPSIIMRLWMRVNRRVVSLPPSSIKMSRSRSTTSSLL